MLLEGVKYYKEARSLTSPRARPEDASSFFGGISRKVPDSVVGILLNSRVFGLFMYSGLLEKYQNIFPEHFIYDSLSEIPEDKNPYDLIRDVFEKIENAGYEWSDDNFGFVQNMHII